MTENPDIKDIYNPFNHAPVFYVKETSSTMTLARKIVKEYTGSGKAVSGIVVRAGYQSAGRGRIPGRVWEASPDENLPLPLS